MTAWDPAVLADVGAAYELDIAPARRDGNGVRTPVPIWHVVVDGELHVRSYRGTGASWYRAAMERGHGQIMAGGRTVDVTFAPDDEDVIDAVSAGYRAKYGRSPYVAGVLSDESIEAAVLIRPAD